MQIDFDEQTMLACGKLCGYMQQKLICVHTNIYAIEQEHSFIERLLSPFLSIFFEYTNNIIYNIYKL